jgi:glycosyltransferase involved in cell wall biosynthesis
MAGDDIPVTGTKEGTRGGAREASPAEEFIGPRQRAHGAQHGGSGDQPHALILANRLPWPLDDGWKVRTFHVIAGVASHARATLVVFHPLSDRALVDAARAALGERVRLLALEPPPSYTFGNLVRGLVTPTPVHVWNQESASMRRVVQDIVASDPPDLVIAESTFMARYLTLVPEGVPSIVDTHNIDSVTFARYVHSLPLGFRRAYASVTVRRLASLETATFRSASGVWVCSDIERELAQRSAPSTRIWTVPNGVDTTYFAPSAGAPTDTSRLLFFGRLDYFPNVDGMHYFAREILPRIEAGRPGTRVDVVGASATRELRELAARTPALQLSGRAPDLRAAIEAAAVVVVPLRVGGGTRLKILEALSMAKPVVSTRIGAEGLDVTDGEHIVLADSADAFADAVLGLLGDPARAARLGAAGRARVRERYDWSHVRGIVAGSMDVVMQRGQGEDPAARR